MMNQLLFDGACLLVFGVLLGAEEWMRRRRVAAEAQQLMQRRYDIERATRAMAQQIHTRYQLAAWTAVQHAIQRRTEQELRRRVNPH